MSPRRKMSAKTVMKIQIAMHQISNANIVHRTLPIPHSVASMTGSPVTRETCRPEDWGPRCCSRVGATATGTLASRDGHRTAGERASDGERWGARKLERRQEQGCD